MDDQSFLARRLDRAAAPLAVGDVLVLIALLTGGTLFVLGSLKVFITGRKWLISGLEMLIVGGIASAAAYGVGVALSGLA